MKLITVALKAKTWKLGITEIVCTLAFWLYIHFYHIPTAASLLSLQHRFHIVIVYLLSFPCISVGDTAHVKPLEPLAGGTYTHTLAVLQLIHNLIVISHLRKTATLSMHAEIPGLSDSTLHNIKDSLSNCDLQHVLASFASCSPVC